MLKLEKCRAFWFWFIERGLPVKRERVINLKEIISLIVPMIWHFTAPRPGGSRWKERFTIGIFIQRVYYYSEVLRMLTRFYTYKCFTITFVMRRRVVVRSSHRGDVIILGVCTIQEAREEIHLPGPMRFIVHHCAWWRATSKCNFLKLNHFTSKYGRYEKEVSAPSTLKDALVHAI